MPSTDAIGKFVAAWCGAGNSSDYATFFSGLAHDMGLDDVVLSLAVVCAFVDSDGLIQCL